MTETGLEGSVGDDRSHGGAVGAAGQGGSTAVTGPLGSVGDTGFARSAGDTGSVGSAGESDYDDPRGGPGGPGGPAGLGRNGSPFARRLVIALLAIVGVLVVLFFVATFWVGSHLHGAGGAEVDVNVPQGTSTTGIVNLMTRNGVVSDGWLFRLYLRYEGAGGFAAGTYAFHHHEGYSSALHDLRQGPKVVLDKVTIPEGFTLAQIAQRVGKLPGHSSDGFLAAAQSGAVRSRFEPPGSNNLEGLVFPDTYLVPPDETDQALLQQMVSEFDQVGSDLGMDAPAPLANGLTAYQTLVVASMIEREAKVPEDRGMIARVILNRLHRGMKLQIDATVLYAIGLQTTNITKSDLNVNSPFNTYRFAGLPPSPISNPGRASIMAALSPTPGTWLYYVLADASGKHAFATTDAEFRQLEAQARAKGLLG